MDASEIFKDLGDWYDINVSANTILLTCFKML